MSFGAAAKEIVARKGCVQVKVSKSGRPLEIKANDIKSFTPHLVCYRGSGQYDGASLAVPMADLRSTKAHWQGEDHRPIPDQLYPWWPVVAIEADVLEMWDGAPPMVFVGPTGRRIWVICVYQLLEDEVLWVWRIVTAPW